MKPYSLPPAPKVQKVLVSLCAVFVSLVCTVFAAGRETPPNIIVILSDDLGYRDLGCYGADKIPTPNCDRLAQDGMRFTDAHTPSAVCTPTRYGLLTGRYCWRTWMKNWVLMEHMPLLIEPERETIASMVKKHGYITGAFGKWHLGWGTRNGDYLRGELEPGPLEVGFDTFFGVPYSHNSTPPMRVFVRDREIVGMKPGESIASKEVQNRVCRSLPDTALNLSKEAVAFIKENRDKPFFLYYPTTNVHFPVTPNKRFKEKSGLGVYGDFVVEFDWMVGQVMDALDECGLTDKTLLIVTSDNGSINNGSNLPLRGKKGDIHEGGHRVPFIVRWPGRIESGTTVDAPICLTDIMPTMAELLGVTLPDGSAEDGESFLALLYGKPLPHPRKPMIHHSVNGMFAIREGRWKLIDGMGNGFTADWKKTEASGRNKPTRSASGAFEDLVYYFPPDPEPHPGEPAGQLFDMENDPYEKNNLWDENPEIVSRLLKLLNDERKQQSGPVGLPEDLR